MTDESTPSGSGSRHWSQVWQLPVLLLGGLLLVVGFLSLPGEKPPDYGKRLDAVRQLVRAGQYEQAIERLNRIREVYPALSDPLKVEYNLVRGDAVARAQADRGWNAPANHRAVIDHYTRARDELEHELNTARQVQLAESLIAIGRIDKAEAVIESLPEAGRLQRFELKRKVLESALGSTRDPAGMVRLLERFLSSPDLPREHQKWAVARVAQIMMADGRADEAAGLLSRWLQRLNFAEREDLGRLMVLLGQALLDAGDPGGAEEWFLRARAQLDPADPVHGEALTGLGRIRFQEDNIVEALEHFSDAVQTYPTTRTYLPALIGKAECEARLAAHPEALSTYEQAVAAAADQPDESADVRRVARSLARQATVRYEQGEYELALSYLKLEKKLFSGTLPEELTLQLARTHERLAQSIAGVTDASAASSEQLEQLSPVQRGRMGLHYELAGDYYYRHAQAVSATDDEAYSESLWRSANAFDRAGLHEQAIARFEEYAATSGEDSRHLQVRYRLAQAYQADAQFEAAIKLYRELNDEHPKSPEAYASLVPLARCYLALGSEQWDKAERVLLSVVSDHEALRPESREYRDALIELGRLYYRRGEPGDHEKAMQRFSEVVARYAETPEAMPAVQFQLGDSIRKSVTQIDAKLNEPLSPSERAQFEAERAQRLAEAQQAFAAVIEAYEKLDPERMTELQRLYLRNAYFYRADCAYDLGRFEGPDGAIALYDQAAQRYKDEPAALVAMIQIVNSYCELGRFDLARTANERARRMLERIPDPAFDDPYLPMSREHWQRWLSSTTELVADASAAGPP